MDQLSGDPYGGLFHHKLLEITVSCLLKENPSKSVSIAPPVIITHLLQVCTNILSSLWGHLENWRFLGNISVPLYCNISEWGPWVCILNALRWFSGPLKFESHYFNSVSWMSQYRTHKSQFLNTDWLLGQNKGLLLTLSYRKLIVHENPNESFWII